MRQDPFMSFRFRVEFDHVQHGGFSRAKGFAREVKADAYREGGQNEFEHRLASHVTYGNIVLERGLADPYLWDWSYAVTEGRITRRDLTVSLVDAQGAPLWRWLVDGAFPVKWAAGDLDAGGAHVVVESVELAHHGFRKG